MKRLEKSLLIVGFFLLLLSGNFQSYAQLSFSTQPEKVQTRIGNKQFAADSFADAEASYKKALDIKNNMPEAAFNLGDAEYKQKRYDDAAKQFQLSAQTNQDPQIKAKAYHNLGNTFMEQKKWEDAIKAYKNALKFNPKDADTKYNLAYANSKLPKNKGGGGQNNKDQKDKDKKDKDKKDDKNKDQQNKDNKDNKDKNDQKKQDQGQKDQDKKDQQQQQKPGQQSKLSKEQADKLLQALMDEEQKTNQKMQQKQVKVVKGKIKKDW